MPDGIEGCAIGDGVQRYRDLRDVERKLDAAMMRKRLDIQDSQNRNVKVGVVIRLNIANYV
jgi:SWI/SNF-related matrix-associated actin-dependent regulator of chromatin subfamily D